VLLAKFRIGAFRENLSAPRVRVVGLTAAWRGLAQLGLPLTSRGFPGSQDVHYISLLYLLREDGDRTRELDSPRAGSVVRKQGTRGRAPAG
jgi:hypothetical protein